MKKKKTGRRVLSFLLTLAMVVGLLSGMSLTAQAAEETLLTTITPTGKTTHSATVDGVVTVSHNNDYYNGNYGWLWFDAVDTLTVSACEGYTITKCIFKQNAKRPVTDSSAPFELHFDSWGGSICRENSDMDGVTSIEVYGYATVGVTGVSLDKTIAQTIDVDGKVSFTATVAPDNATDKKVKWNVGGTDTGAVKLYSDEACTTEVGTDATETLTVYAKGISAGSATVTATSNADSEKKASCDVTVNAAQTQTETLLTTITATGKEQANYSTANVATVSFSYTAGGSSAYYANWGWWGYGWSATVNAAEGYTITKCVFYDDKDRTATDSKAPFVVETTEEDKTPQVNGKPILANQSKGIKKIEVYGYATPTATHSVTITAGDHMTKTAGSGDAEQTGLTGAMKDVVYTADNGYYFPTNYSVAEVSGIKVTRDSYTQITVSGTPTADAAITLTAPTAKTTPAAPTTAAAVDCTTTDNNDGKLTGVTTAMEYKKSDDDSWTTGTGSDITGLVPGTYYVRVKATETTNASTNQELTVKGFISYTVTFKVVNGKWNKGEGDAATADKTVTLTGHDGDTLKLTADQIPAVGTKPNDTYKVGSWDVTPSADKKITADTTYTYTYAAKEASVVTKAPEAKTLTYNGSAQELVTAGKATGGEMKYALGTATKATQPYTTSIPTGTNAGTYYVWYKVKADENHNDTDANYVEVSIGKRSVTLTSATASKTYDGTALTNTKVTVGGDGFVTGEGATYNVTGTQTLPGNSKNTFGYTLKTGTTAGNYEITKIEGTLTVTDRTKEEGNDKKYEITVTANSAEVTYDGTEKSVSGFVQTTFTFNGVTYTVSGLTATAKGTDAGSYTVEVKGTAVVKDSKNNDLTKQFVVSTSNGTLTINKRNVTLTSATASKTYDGNALTDNTVTTSGDGFAKGEGATYSVTGSQKVVGSSANAFTYTLNTGTKEANYNITKTEGTLTVTSRGAKYQISPQANSDELKYDGQSHEVTGFKTDTFTVEGNTYTVSGLTAAGSGTDAGSYTVSVSGTAVVKDSDGNDVSDQFSVIPQTGTLTINKRSVTLTSASDEKEYDGDALTNDEVTVTGDGFVTGEGATYDVTGTRTLVGSSKNDFTYTLNEGTKADNYDITPSFGTLTVTNRNTKYEVTLKANSGTEKYDGKEKTVSGYTIDGKAGEGTGESVVTSFTASNGKTYTVTGMSAEVTGTNAGEYVVNVIGTPIVKDADGNDVTAQFAISVESGKLTIGKRSVTLTSATDTKVYDGKALSNDEITVSEDGFAEGEGATYSVTGSQKVVGSSANAFTYSLNEGTIADNYDITTVEGKLTVTKSDSSGEVTAVSGLVYDGKAKALVTARKTEGGTLMYRLGTDGKWQQDIPEATNAGTYKIYYYIKGDDNHKDDGSEKEPKGSVETTIKKATINLKSVTQKNNKVQVRWTKVNEADGYDVYVRYCGSKAKKPVKTIKKNTTTKTSVAKINGKKINHKKNFYVKVYAYKMVNGKKKIIAKTITAHLAGTKSVKYTNPKALKLTKSTYSIKVGKTSKIKAKVTLKNSKKKLLPKSHAAKLRYKSSNTKIATVNKNGTIKGKKKGTCYIYVYTVNGLMKKVKVTVK